MKTLVLVLMMATSWQVVAVDRGRPKGTSMPRPRLPRPIRLPR